jgi:hypothetical protein
MRDETIDQRPKVEPSVPSYALIGKNLRDLRGEKRFWGAGFLPQRALRWRRVRRVWALGF